MNYQIVGYHPSFKERIAELQTQLWSQDQALNAVHFAWKYEQNPYLERPIIHLVLRGGELVGMRGMYGANWQVGRPPREFLVPCPGDLAIAPAHRNQGLAVRLIERAFEDLAEPGPSDAISGQSLKDDRRGDAVTTSL